jgi:hypothetical protein
MKRLSILFAAVASLALSACGSSSSNDPVTPPPVVTPFPRPAGTIAVNFVIDDTAGKVFAGNEMAWKGNMLYDAATRKITIPNNWDGPFAPLYDDGPWDQGGHEPLGAVAGDHKLGAAVFITPPPAGGNAITAEYGLIDTKFGDGWIWPKATNGSFTINPGRTTDLDASGGTLAGFGTTDLKVTLDTSALTPPDTGTWATNTITLKGKFTAWNTVDVVPSKVGTVYTFVASDSLGAGKKFYHSGLFASGAAPEWVFMLGGLDYKALGVAASGGVTAYTKAAGTNTWVSQPIVLNAGNNTSVVVP